jgi:glycosyltransferase involved in cell wall biosynthesis
MASATDSQAFVDDGSLTIVVPSYNECENLPHTLQDIATAFASLPAKIELLVVDDGSTDDTSGALRLLEGQLPLTLRSERHEANKGLGAALQTGIAAARSAWIGWLPADGQFSPGDLLKLYEGRVDAVASVGRVEVAKRRTADSLVRVTLSLTLRMIMRFLHPHIPDFNGVMVFRRNVIHAPELVCRTGFVNMEILDRIRRTCEGAQIRERYVSVLSRRSGASKVANFRTVLIVVEDLLRLRLNYILSKRERRFKSPKRLKYLEPLSAAASRS